MCRTRGAQQAVETLRIEFHGALVRSERFRRLLLLHKKVSQELVCRESGSWRHGVLWRRGLKLGGLSHQRNAGFFLPSHVGEPGIQLEPEHSDVAGKQVLLRLAARSFEFPETLAGCSGLLDFAQVCRAQAP